MKTFEIKIKSQADADKEFIQVFKALKTGKKVKRTKGVYFASLEAVRNLLTEKRLELLHTIREKRPISIYQLAKITGRNFRNVYDDLQILKNYGLVKMNKSRPIQRTRNQQISVPYQVIDIRAVI